jgi:HK97 family phage portal protein
VKILGFHVPFTEKATDTNALTPISDPYRVRTPVVGWVVEAFGGMWQRNLIGQGQDILSFSSVFACVTLIARDIAKLDVELMRLQPNGSWVEEESTASPYLGNGVLGKPNRYQTMGQFIEGWMLSKLLWGNTYVLKERDARGIVRALYVLNPQSVTPLIAPDGDVFYQLGSDKLAGIDSGVPMIPMAEIIHDRWNCLHHSLIGVSPLYASTSSAVQGTSIQTNSEKFFRNMSRPGGQLTAPGSISDEVAARLKATFEQNFSGDNIGRLLVAGDGLKFEPFTIPAEQAQLIEQLKWTVEDAARAFLVPLWKIGAGPYPGDVTSANQEYYNSVLHSHVENIERLLDDGLGLPAYLDVEIDVDELLRMDKKRRFETLEIGTRSAVLAPNEARTSEGLPPVTGGDSPMMQQQNYSLEALAKRDAQADPFAPATAPKPPPAEEPTPPDSEAVSEEAVRSFLKHVSEGLRCPA